METGQDIQVRRRGHDRRTSARRDYFKCLPTSFVISNMFA